MSVSEIGAVRLNSKISINKQKVTLTASEYSSLTRFLRIIAKMSEFRRVQVCEYSELTCQLVLYVPSDRYVQIHHCWMNYQKQMQQKNL